MLSDEAKDRYRRMTPGERLEITLEMIREATPCLLEGDPGIVDRRFELLRRQNDERNRRMLRGMARSRRTQ